MNTMEKLFDNVSTIKLIYHEKVMTQQNDFEQLKAIFQSVKFTETNESLAGIMGSLLLDFTYNDHSVKSICFTANLLSDGTKTYRLDHDICLDVRYLFS